MNQIEFLKQKEQQLIDAVGEDEWYEQKVYDVDEVAEFMKDHTTAVLTSLLTSIDQIAPSEFIEKCDGKFNIIDKGLIEKEAVKALIEEALNP